MFQTSGYSHYPWLTNGGQVNNRAISPIRPLGVCNYLKVFFFSTLIVQYPA